MVLKANYHIYIVSFLFIQTPFLVFGYRPDVYINNLNTMQKNTSRDFTRQISFL